MFELVKYFDLCPDNSNLYLITYYTKNRYFCIQKFRDEEEYTLTFFPLNSKLSRMSDFRILGKFKTLKQANEYAYKWYIDNL